LVNNSLDTVFSLNELAEINQTISQIYDRTTKNPTQSLSDFSASFLKDLNKHVDFDKGNILFYNYNPKVSTYEVSYFYHIGWNKNDINNYVNHYCHIDDVLPILSSDREIAFRNGNIFSFWEQTKYYKEFVKPAQIVNSIDANILLPKNIETNAIIGLFRNTNKTGFSQKDFEIVKTCQPHLSNALSQYLNSKQKPANDLLDIFTNIETISVCVLNDDLKLVTYNSAYKAQATSLEECAIHDSELTKIIQELCANLKKKDKRFLKHGPISITFNNQSYPVEVVYSKRSKTSNKFICLILTDNYALRLKKLQSTYNLTARECEILDLILQQGLSNEEISSCLYISPSTVKKHLTSVYQKTDVSNQKQLNSLFRKI
jgi:DNA-binding CsgD family transcriptional regulator